MKTPKKSIGTRKTKIAIPQKMMSTARFKKLNFKATKELIIKDLEIKIRVDGNDIIAHFYNKGELQAQQIVRIKPKPTPPPVIQEVINALNLLQLNLTVKE